MAKPASAKVLVFGTFDILHKGHEYFLKQSKRHGTTLIVVVARDSTVKTLKGLKPENSEKKRINVLKRLAYIDEVHIGNKDDKYRIIEKTKPNIICLGYDQKFFADQLQDELVKRNISAKIVRIGAYEPQKYKSSIIKQHKTH